MGSGRSDRTRCAVGHRAGATVGRPGRPQHADPAHPRPLRPSRRRDRIRPRLPPTHDGRHRPRPARRAVGRRPPGRPRGAGRQELGVDRGTRSPVPDLDDVRRRPRAALQPRTAEGLRAAADQPRIRPGTQGAGHQGRDHRGYVDDREAGRLRRPRRHHAGRPQRRRQLFADRAQMVHLGGDERHLPGAGAGAAGSELLPAAAGAARRQPQPDVHPAAQGQAGQPRQRLERGRVRRGHRLAGRRGGPRRADHHRDGQPDPAGLRPGQCDQHAHRTVARGPSHAAPKGVRRVSD